MKIKQFSVRGLFHTFNYNVQWGDDDSNILLLTGPNGYGKTTILSIIKYLFDGQLYYFYKLPFDEIKLIFETNEAIVVCKADSSGDEDDSQGIDDKTLYIEKDVLFKVETSKDKSIDVRFSTNDARYIEHMVQKNIQRRPFLELKHKLGFQEVINHLSSIHEPYAFLREKEKGFGEFLMYITSFNTHYIPANRLNSEFDNQTKLSVFHIQELLEKAIRNAQIEYLHKVSDSRNHMIEKMISGETLHTKQEYLDFIEKQREKITALHEWGLTPFREIIPYKEGKDMVFSVYLDELNTTLPAYDALYKKLNLFSQLLERKNFVNKKIIYSPQHGIQAMTKDGVSLGLDCLSSGEQNEICMCYDFIFKVPNNSILLIDEPENSLHIEWQSQFYEELLAICETNNVQAIVATHSPQIIGERWDQCFDLYEQIEE